MPPRRSSRAASASLEVPPTETAPAKRKRGQTTEPDAEEKENVAKPPPRTRRSSAVRSSVPPPSKARKSSRSKVSLPDVPESDNEEQSDAPPPKKARPSLDSRAEEDIKVEQDGDEIQKEKPKRARRGASTKPTSATVDMDLDDEVPSRSSSRRTSNRKAALSSGSRVSAASEKSGGTPGSARVEEGLNDESDEEEVKPVKGRRGAGKRGASKAVQSDEDEDEDVLQVAEEEEEEEDVKPIRKGRKPKAPAVRKGKATAKKATKPAVVEDSDDDLEAPPSAQPRFKAPASAAEQAPADVPAEDEEVEETSLFEPPPMSAPSSLPQAMPEEPAGPKARLVIHKMALVNFKSYAGRQEIGPFHKVCHSLRLLHALKKIHSCSCFPLSLVPMDLESQTLSMHSSSCLVIAPLK